MRITELQVGLKLTKDYNSYQMSLTAEIEANEDTHILGLELLGKCYKTLNQYTGINPTTAGVKKEESVEVKTPVIPPKEKAEWKKCSCGKLCKKGFRQAGKYYCAVCKLDFE